MTLWATAFFQRGRGGKAGEGPHTKVAEAADDAPVLVDQYHGLLLIRVSAEVPPGPDDVVELARSLANMEDIRRTATVVVAAAGEAPLALWQRLADTLDTFQANGATTVRVVLCGAGGGRAERSELAQQVADAWDLDVIAPEASVMIVPGGSLFAPDLTDPSRGWRLFSPGRTPRTLGPRHPAPAWQTAFQQLPARTATGCVVEQIPAGVLVRSPRARATHPGDLCHAVPVDRDRPLVVVGSTGPAEAADIPSDDLSALLAALPPDVRATVRLASGNHTDPLPAAQEVSDSLGIEVEVLTGIPVMADGTGAEDDTRGVPALVGRDDTLTWAPLVEAVVCLPTAMGGQAAEPRLLRWRSPVPRFHTDATSGNGIVRLSERWQVSVTRAGLHLGAVGTFPPSRCARPVEPDRLFVDIGLPGEPLDDSMYPVLSRLLFDLSPEYREYVALRALGGLFDEGRRLRRLAIRHGVRLLWTKAPVVLPEPEPRAVVEVTAPAPVGALPRHSGTETADTGDDHVEAFTSGDDLWSATDTDTGDGAPGTASAPSETVPVAYQEDIARIVSAADEGRHAMAAILAQALEWRVVADHGENHASSLRARQVRAHVARLAGDHVLAAEVYRDVALALFAARGADDPETEQAAANAESCWGAVKDPSEAHRIAPSLIALFDRLPGPGGRRLGAARRRTARLDDLLASARRPSAGAVPPRLPSLTATGQPAPRTTPPSVTAPPSADGARTPRHLPGTERAAPVSEDDPREALA